MDCQGVRAAMYRVSDNELEADLLVVFREHLRRCPDCSHEFDFVSKLLALVRGRCSRYAAPSSLRVRILASFPHREGA
jgi:mycothiol system anti-sigma-R factor